MGFIDASGGFVGREDELESLHALLTGARNADGAALLIEGDPGIGKTTLIEQALAGARELRILRAPGFAAESTLPYAAGNETPTVCVIDDTHRLDREPLAVLGFVARRLTVAAAESTGDAAAVRTAAHSLGLSLNAPPPAKEARLVDVRDAVRDASGALKVQITQKWLTVRDKYSIDIADGVDPGMAFALVWAIDRWVERD